MLYLSPRHNGDWFPPVQSGTIADCSHSCLSAFPAACVHQAQTSQQQRRLLDREQKTCEWNGSCTLSPTRSPTKNRTKLPNRTVKCQCFAAVRVMIFPNVKLSIYIIPSTSGPLQNILLIPTYENYKHYFCFKRKIPPRLRTVRYNQSSLLQWFPVGCATVL